MWTSTKSYLSAQMMQSFKSKIVTLVKASVPQNTVQSVAFWRTLWKSKIFIVRTLVLKIAVQSGVLFEWTLVRNLVRILCLSQELLVFFSMGKFPCCFIFESHFFKPSKLYLQGIYFWYLFFYSWKEKGTFNLRRNLFVSENSILSTFFNIKVQKNGP